MTAQAYRRQLVPDKQSGSSVCDVADPNVEPVVLPVRFDKFHRRGFLNYQFNRAHGQGWADGKELRDAAARTRSTETAWPYSRICRRRPPLTADHAWERAGRCRFGLLPTCVCRAGRHLHGRVLGIAGCGAGTAHRSRGRVATRFRLASPVTGGHARSCPDDAAAQTADALGCANPGAIDTDSAANRRPHLVPD
jgi:hypothetical protein